MKQFDQLVGKKCELSLLNKIDMFLIGQNISKLWRKQNFFPFHSQFSHPNLWDKFQELFLNLSTLSLNLKVYNFWDTISLEIVISFYDLVQCPDLRSQLMNLLL